MTYCVAIKLNKGLVMLSDSRTNATLGYSVINWVNVIFQPRCNRLAVLTYKHGRIKRT